MALILKILASGSLTSTLTTLYPASDAVVAGKSALIKNIILVNKHASATATVNIMIRQQVVATDIYVAPVNLQLPAGQAFVLDDEITLYVATGPDRVRASAANGDVQYVVNGFERDI